MTESKAIRAATILRENGCFDAAYKMEEIAETSRRQHFQDMQNRCYDDIYFADAYETDRLEGF